MALGEIRIGIDVGGTFTDAVAVDASSLQLIGHVKVPTTHRGTDGVAGGIVQALERLLETFALDPSRVRFISHGTTQATNALLEGDVARVGVLGIGGGLEGLRARSQTRIGSIALPGGGSIDALHVFVHAREPQDAQIAAALADLRGRGAQAIVAAGLYSVDDPTTENRVLDAARAAGVPATGTHEVSKLYGLRTRTRTAAINASILPKMLETADSVERSVAAAGITAPLMIMRGDGGVMSLQQLRRRPLLTLVSGPAAGVAGALMEEKVSDAIFLEVGGTSVDISAIRDGRVQLRYATLGGHRTYLQSLDVRSVGIGGGSIVRVHEGRIDVGPRSAHIAGLGYTVYDASPSSAEDSAIALRPLPSDPDDYIAVDRGGTRLALTLSCAANVAGFVPEGDWARGDDASARRAFLALARRLGRDAEAVARDVVDAAVRKVRATVEELIDDYAMMRETLVLVGGGGGAATLVPALAASMGCEFRLARHAAVISPLGVALALVREVVERMIPGPTADDLRRVRAEAEDAVVAAGAARETVEVDVVVDAQRNVVRAVATGATELRTRDLTRGDAGEDERRRAAAQSLAASPEGIELVMQTPDFSVYKSSEKTSGWLSRFSKPKEAFRVVDREGVVRLRLSDAALFKTTTAEVPAQLRTVLDRFTTYGDAGKMLPALHVLVRDKIISLAGLPDPDLVVSTAADHLRTADPAECSVIVAEVRS